MATKEQIEAAGNAYWNYYRSLSGHQPEVQFRLDQNFANAINAAVDAAARVANLQSPSK